MTPVHQIPTFFQDVEALFIRLRGRGGVQIPPRDWPLIREWHDRGVPFDVLESVMRAGFAKNRDIGSIRYFERPIENEMRRRAALNLGGPSRPQPETLETANPNAATIRYLDEVVAAFDAAIPGLPDPVIEQVKSARSIIDRLRRDLRRQEPFDSDKHEAALASLEDAVFHVAKDSLGNARYERLLESCRSLLANEHRRQDSATFEETVLRRARTEIFNYYKLPRLSLFYVQG